MWYIIALLQLVPGFLLIRIKTTAVTVLRTWIWIVPILDIVGGYFLVDDPRPWYRMLIYIFLLFLGMKMVSAVYRYPGSSKLNFIHWLAYNLGWPGMDPQPFELLSKGKTSFPKKIFIQGLLSFVSGNILLLLLAALLNYTSVPAYVICLVAFVPIVMIFHSGLFNLVAVLWNMLGVPVTPLMDVPWKSENAGSFWGKRWNVAFIQMTKITLFLPLARKGKTRLALLLSFFISGIFHEVALSLPVRAGFGLPMLYFVLQSVFVLSERRFSINRLSPAGQKVLTWLFILLPFPLLIHPAFANGIILPFLKYLGEIFF
jgi:hypothetical protein